MHVRVQGITHRSGESACAAAAQTGKGYAHRDCAGRVERGHTGEEVGVEGAQQALINLFGWCVCVRVCVRACVVLYVYTQACGRMCASCARASAQFTKVIEWLQEKGGRCGCAGLGVGCGVGR